MKTDLLGLNFFNWVLEMVELNSQLKMCSAKETLFQSLAPVQVIIIIDSIIWYSTTKTYFCVMTFEPKQLRQSKPWTERVWLLIGCWRFVNKLSGTWWIQKATGHINGQRVSERGELETSRLLQRYLKEINNCLVIVLTHHGLQTGGNKWALIFSARNSNEIQLKNNVVFGRHLVANRHYYRTNCIKCCPKVCEQYGDCQILCKKY